MTCEAWINFSSDSSTDEENGSGPIGKKKMSNLDTRFDKLEGAQSEIAGKQESRFDRFETL